FKPIYAGFWIRVAASFVDSFVIATPLLLLFLLFGFFLPKDSALSSLANILFTIVFWAVDIYFVTKYGAAPGKMFFGLKIVTADGKYPGIKKALLREILGKIISGLLLNLGYLWVVFDKQKQGFHDKIAGTYVLVTKPLTGGRRILVFILASLFPLAIMGILAAAVLVAVNPVARQQQAKDAVRKVDIGQIATALVVYSDKNNKFPDTLDDLVKSGDLQLVPTDPTGAKYWYLASSDHSSAVAYALLDANKNQVWCWRSKTGTSQLATECTP
ncbi:MAG: RDD family protein, partial [Candidatus Paceibacterales bacterium]